MKLKRFEHREGYRFLLTFENGESTEVDLQKLIGAHVTPDGVHTARIDPEWGCLEFNCGAVDIEPKTLYHFAKTHGYKDAA
ncbi:DUF2442 domain-containing protein [Methylogaea oryzae]|uniref:DUF2442 domain-containing protein n=1 Tax=Methylogaea oryzae TaxID=1295382 RepID=A0A8D5AGE2_9GAMM|nr:DUF2442 domain-containing protein [Methylogaea oryzae]BBL70288.1 hypothetical protein MoryE10_08940 [Methylogaea oryzae]